MKTIDAAMKHPSGRISAMVGPSQIDTCKEGYFKEAHQEAKRRNIPMQTHACQAVVEFYEMVHRHGKTPIEWLDSIGVLGPDLVIGHGIFLSDHPQIHYPHANDFEMLQRLRRGGGALPDGVRPPRHGAELDRPLHERRHHRRHRHRHLPAQHGR